MINNGTIAAIATPPGKGGVALIRISGDQAFAIADACFSPASKGKKLSSYPPRTAVRGDVILEGEHVDDGLAYCFPAPHSYTGEDTVEICCHGGLLVTRTVLEACLSAGARMAEAGEFTRRAYLNGKLSLTEAEAIGDLLEATSRGQIKLSSRESRSKLSLALGELYEELVLLLSTLYAAIDYPEEDLAGLSNQDLLSRLQALEGRISALCATYRTGRTITEGIATTICGKPNVGKSSLYNLLCCEDAAIVTDIAGTTRDVLERTVALGDITLRLCDTAGVRETKDVVEQIGVERSLTKLEESELIFAVFDSSSPLTEEDTELIERLGQLEATIIAIINKADLPSCDMSPVTSRFEHVVKMSCKSSNSTELESLVTRLFTDGNIRVGYDAIISSARQYAALTKAKELVVSTISALEFGLPADVASSDLELALGALSELDGRAVSESIVSSIFSHFCVGK